MKCNEQTFHLGCHPPMCNFLQFDTVFIIVHSSLHFSSNFLRSKYGNWCLLTTNTKGSVYVTADFLAATDRLELLCRQSDAIRIKRSVCHTVSVLLVVLWLCFMSSMPLVFGSNLTLVTFLFYAFLKTFPLGVTFRVRLGWHYIIVRALV